MELQIRTADGERECLSRLVIEFTAEHAEIAEFGNQCQLSFFGELSALGGKTSTLLLTSSLA